MNVGKLFLGLVLALILLVGLGWILSLNDLSLTRFFAPRQEEVRRQTFEQSKAFNQGMIQDLTNYQIAYVQAKSADERQVIANAVTHRFADFDLTRLSPDQYQFVIKMKGEAQ